eukprot:jgi/Tetstr1/462236/TSEL_000635.t1
MTPATAMYGAGSLASYHDAGDCRVPQFPPEEILGSADWKIRATLVDQYEVACEARHTSAKEKWPPATFTRLTAGAVRLPRGPAPIHAEVRAWRDASLG